jgi:hypothetical protein
MVLHQTYIPEQVTGLVFIIDPQDVNRMCAIYSAQQESFGVFEVRIAAIFKASAMVG